MLPTSVVHSSLWKAGSCRQPGDAEQQKLLGAGAGECPSGSWFCIFPAPSQSLKGVLCTSERAKCLEWLCCVRHVECHGTAGETPLSKLWAKGLSVLIEHFPLTLAPPSPRPPTTPNHNPWWSQSVAVAFVNPSLLMFNQVLKKRDIYRLFKMWKNCFPIFLTERD